MTSTAIKRPIATTMACLGVMLFGCISLFNVQIDLLPDINFPVITIKTEVAGYPPPEVENIITKPIEAIVSTMDNVHRLLSTSAEGLSSVQVEFNLGTDMDFAFIELKERINLIRDAFPIDARNPQVNRYNPSEAPIMNVAAYGDVTPIKLRQITETYIEKIIQRIEGVGNVEIKGGLEREIVLEIDPGRLKATGLSIMEIANTLKQNNLNAQVGSIEYGNYSLNARITGEYSSIAQIEDLGISRSPSGSIVALKDIGRILDAYRREYSLARFQGEPRVMLYVQKESGANIISISKLLRKELAKLQKELPNGIKIEIVYDQADYINASINRLRKEAIVGAGLAMLIIFLFLQNFQSVLVIGLSIPISIVGTFSLMHLFGVSLNIISLSGFTLGVGMLLDNAIVVLENISRKREIVADKIKSALQGTKEVSNAIIVSTFAHIAVFLPVIYLQKKIRIFYGGLFFTVSFSLLASLLVALTIVPLLSSKIQLKSVWSDGKNRKSHIWYRHILLASFRNRAKIITACAILFMGTLFLIPHIGFESMARLDRGIFKLNVRTPPGTNLAATNAVAKAAEKILMTTPEVKEVTTEVNTEFASIRVQLHTGIKRNRTTRQVVDHLRPKLAVIPRSQIYFDIDTGNTAGNKISIEINGYDQKKSMALGFGIKQKILELSSITDVVIRQANPQPEIDIRVIRDKAGAYGLNASRISDAVRSRVTGPIATEYLDQGKEIDLRIRIKSEDIKSISDLKEIYIPIISKDKKRTIIPLGEVCTFEEVEGISEIHRKDQHRIIGVTADIGRWDMGTAAAAIEEKLKDFPFPNGYGYNFSEDYQELKKSQKEMLFAFSLAIVLVYMILTSLFESFGYPLIIMISVPMATIGSFFILYLSDKSINMPVYIGTITLAGIVVNNAIVLIDYIIMLRYRGLGKWRAIIRGGENRLRPILMTSASTLLALLPMAIDKGEGSNLWSPLALTIIGGLVTSTILTLVILPILASFINDKRFP